MRLTIPPSDGNRQVGLEYGHRVAFDLGWTAAQVSRADVLQDRPITAVPNRDSQSPDEQPADDALFFTHIREAARVFRGR